MKKIFVVSCAIISLFLCSCQSASIGIIGGADGPTAVYVGKSNEKVKGTFGEQLEKKPVRMFNAGGELYYDLGIVREGIVKCGTLDGELKKTVKENEIPLNDGEANFNVEGYQHSLDDTKEVNIDGKWIVFKKFDTYGNALDGFKYCYYIKGHLNNAATDSEIIVLSKSENVTFNDVFEPLLSSKFVTDSSVGKILFNPLNN